MNRDTTPQTKYPLDKAYSGIPGRLYGEFDFNYDIFSRVKHSNDDAIKEQLEEHFWRVVAGCSCGCGDDDRDILDASRFDLDFGDPIHLCEEYPENLVDLHRCRERFSLGDQLSAKRAA